MKRKTIFTLTLLIIIGMLAAPVLAANPHFIYEGAAGPDDNGNLVVSFKIAGLGDTVSTTVTASADAVAVYACQNGGNKFPKDPKKTVVSGPVSNSGNFTAGDNGQIEGLLLLSPPASTLQCPNGQHEVMVSVSYSNVKIESPDAGSENIPGVFSRIWFNI